MTGNGNDAGFEVLISSDSHVMEPSEILAEREPNLSKIKYRVSEIGSRQQFSNPSGRIGSNPSH